MTKIEKPEGFATPELAENDLTCQICGKQLKEGVFFNVSVMAGYFDGHFIHSDSAYRATVKSYVCHKKCVEKRLNIWIDTLDLNTYKIVKK